MKCLDLRCTSCNPPLECSYCGSEYDDYEDWEKCEEQCRENEEEE